MALAVPELSALKLLLDAVVEGTEITPYIVLQDSDCKRYISSDDDSIRCRWLRCDYSCSSDFASSSARACAVCGAPAALQCAVCARLRPQQQQQQQQKLPYYCSTNCLLRAWPQHAAAHASCVPLRDDAYAATLDDCLHHWVTVSDSMSYTPAREDVGRNLRFECTPLSSQYKLEGEAQFLDLPSCLPAPPDPPSRLWISAAASSTNRLPGVTSIRVASFNILAQIYATQQAFAYCPNWALSWGSRRRRILRDIANAKCDIIALQEVQSDHWKQWLLPSLKAMGYDSVYAEKTREAMGAEGQVDGCALCWRSDKLFLRDSRVVSFNAKAMQLEDQLPKYVLNQLLRGCNVGLVVTLSFKQDDRILQPTRDFCCATTHIFSRAEAHGIKLWQVASLLTDIEQSLRRLPLILAGDLNSLPESAVYALLNDANVDARHPEVANDGLNILETVELRHRLLLRDSHAALLRDPSFVTNKTDAFQGVIDYIWYTPAAFRLSRILDPRPNAEFNAKYPFCNVLPSPVSPSDHVLIAAEFDLVGSMVSGGR